MRTHALGKISNITIDVTKFQIIEVIRKNKIKVIIIQLHFVEYK